MTTVLDALENAKFNFETVGRMTDASANPIFGIAMGQLTNAIEALESDKSPHDTLDPK